MPGSPDLERRIKSLVRWNAAAMVVRANKAEEGIGGHISTFASAATLYEVGFNHFFRGHDSPDADVIFFQGHAAPGIYARAYLEGRIDETQLENFRREMRPGGGLSSYPHPWLMPDFWEYPTVSMGLGPIMAIYQARFMRYLEDRGLKDTFERQGLGVSRRRRDRRARSARRDHAAGAREARQPDLRHQLQPAAARRSGARQRPDHPGARSGVPRRRLERHQGDLGPRVGSAAGQGSRRPAREADGRDRRRPVPEVRGRVGRVPPRALLGRRSAAARHGQAPVGRSAEEDDPGRPRSGQGLQRLQGRRRAQGRADRHPGPDDQGLRPRRSRRRQEHHPPAEEDERRGAASVPHPLRDSDLRRRNQQDPVLPPSRRQHRNQIHARASRGARRLRAEPQDSQQAARRRFRRRSSRSSTPAPKAARRRRRWCSCGCCRSCCATRNSGSLVVPIVPDEARTFGMEALFRQVGIYSHAGQVYEPVDMDTLLYYKEASDGQILEEGHQRSRFDVVVHRRRHGLRDARRQHDSVLHLLFDVRLPADRRPDLGRRRLAHAWLPARRHRRPHDAGGRRACSIRTATATCSPIRCRTSSPTIRRLRTRSPSSSRTASAGCTSIRRASSTT